jgi:hypothetical protein
MCVVCCQVEVSRRADHSSRGVLPSVVCLSVIVKPRSGGGPGPLGAVAPLEREFLLGTFLMSLVVSKEENYIYTDNKVILNVKATISHCSNR